VKKTEQEEEAEEEYMYEEEDGGVCAGRTQRGKTILVTTSTKKFLKSRNTGIEIASLKTGKRQGWRVITS
jgi:hypothetical protein